MKRYIKAKIGNILDEDITYQCAVAADPNSDPEILQLLSDSDDVVIRGKVAMNPSTSVEVLSLLADDVDPYVRGCIASNECAPVDILMKLADDSDYRVRVEVALYTEFEDVLRHLAGDGDPKVLEALEENPNMPVNILRKVKRRLNEL